MQHSFSLQMAPSFLLCISSELFWHWGTLLVCTYAELVYHVAELLHLFCMVPPCLEQQLEHSGCSVNADEQVVEILQFCESCWAVLSCYLDKGQQGLERRLSWDLAPSPHLGTPLQNYLNTILIPEEVSGGVCAGGGGELEQRWAEVFYVFLHRDSNPAETLAESWPPSYPWLLSFHTGSLEGALPTFCFGKELHLGAALPSYGDMLTSDIDQKDPDWLRKATGKLLPSLLDDRSSQLLFPWWKQKGNVTTSLSHPSPKQCPSMKT
jgi:hypothetical protein